MEEQSQEAGEGETQSPYVGRNREAQKAAFRKGKRADGQRTANWATEVSASNKPGK